MLKKLQQILSAIKDLYVDVYDETSSSQNRVQSQSISIHDTVDIGFLCHEVEAQCELIRKVAMRHRELCERIICLEIVKDSLQGSPQFKDGLCRGSLASASPDVSQIPKLPSSDTEEYLLLMEYLGVSRITTTADLVKPSWRSLCKHVNNLVEEGKPLPPGIEKTWPVFKTQFRRYRKG